MTATVDVLRQALTWGAEMMIVHEPTYFNHWDEHSDDPVEKEKRNLIEQSGLVIYRYHDHPHYACPDMIASGMLEQMELTGTVTFPEPYNLIRAELHRPITAVAFAAMLEQKLQIKHLRICGARELPCTNISAKFGAPGGVLQELQRPETQIMLTGETTEWSIAEYARDAAALGFNKTLIIMGHVGSERYGMRYVANCLQEKLPMLEVQYFQTPEVYTYTDS